MAFPAVGWRLTDIDIVLTDGTASVGEDIAEDFLINHFHPGRERGNVYMQLVEAERRHG